MSGPASAALSCFAQTKRAALRPPLVARGSFVLTRFLCANHFARKRYGKSMRAVRHGFRAVAPDIDADEQEQPDHVDEMPVPGGEFEAEMLRRRKVPGIGAH